MQILQLCKFSCPFTTSPPKLMLEILLSVYPIYYLSFSEVNPAIDCVFDPITAFVRRREGKSVEVILLNLLNL